MTIIHRRIFYGKVGAADQLVQLMKEGDRILATHGSSFKSTTLTDHMTGRSDRVVVEWELESLGDMDAAMAEVMSKPEAQAEFGPWMEKLSGLIHYAEGENWTVQ